jgi:hypothetical protein
VYVLSAFLLSQACQVGQGDLDEGNPMPSPVFITSEDHDLDAGAAQAQDGCEAGTADECGETIDATVPASNASVSLHLGKRDVQSTSADVQVRRGDRPHGYRPPM